MAEQSAGRLDRSLPRLRANAHAPEHARDLRAAKRLLRDFKLLAHPHTPYFPSIFCAAARKQRGARLGGSGRRPSQARRWIDALAEEPWVLPTKLLGGKTLFVHEDLWPSLDAYIRPLFLQVRRGSLSLASLEQRIVDSLHMEGPTRSDVLRGMLDLSKPVHGRPFRAACHRLEAMGLIVGSEAAERATHERVDRIALWTHRFPRRLDRKLAPYQGLAEFLRSAIHAAVYVPERTFSMWWAWPRDDVKRALEVLVDGGSVLMVSVEGRNAYTTSERAQEAFRKHR